MKTVHLKNYALRITHYALRITHYALRITHYALRITHYALRITHYVLICPKLQADGKGHAAQILIGDARLCDVRVLRIEAEREEITEPDKQPRFRCNIQLSEYLRLREIKNGSTGIEKIIEEARLRVFVIFHRAKAKA